MKLEIEGLSVVRSTDRGTFVEIEVTADSTRLAQVVTSLLAALPDEGEICVPEPGPYECYRECQRTGGALQVKRGCHGSYGTWRTADPVEAHGWLLPGFASVASNPRGERALIRIRRKHA